MDNLNDRLDQISDTKELSNPEIWESSTFRGVILSDIHISCHEAKNINEHQKAADIFRKLLESLTKFIQQNTR